MPDLISMNIKLETHGNGWKNFELQVKTKLSIFFTELNFDK